jgi:hypothetical protein
VATIKSPLRYGLLDSSAIFYPVRKVSPVRYRTDDHVSIALSPDRISIRPDFSRRTPVVDPDDHHIWVSLGCATENMVIAAAVLGKHADVQVDPHEIRVTFDGGPSAPSPLVEAIFQRQCTRADYNGQPLANDVLKDLERAADRSGVRVFLLTERAKIEGVIEYVTQANSAQMRDPAFISELAQRHVQSERRPRAMEAVRLDPASRHPAAGLRLGCPHSDDARCGGMCA